MSATGSLFCARCGAARTPESAFCQRCGTSYATIARAATDRPAAILALVGGAGAILGAFLPWITVTTGFASLSKMGIERDGMFTAGIGALVALYGLLRVSQPAPVTAFRRIALFVAAAFVGGIAIWDLLDVQRRIGNLDSSIVGSVGIGMYVTIAAAVVIAVAGLVSPKGNQSPAA